VHLSILLLTLAMTAPDAVPSAGVSAEENLARGIALYEQHQFREAIVEFEAGYARVPSPTLLFNLALAYEATNRSQDALAAYQKFVAEEDKRVPPDPALAESVEYARGKIVALKGVLPAAAPPLPTLPTLPPGAKPKLVQTAPPLIPAQVDLATKETPDKPSRLKWWLVGAGGLVVAAAATWFVVSRNNRCPGRYDVGCL
jgi:tetratricopeptide (TPR) repeat protein